VDKPH